MTEPLRHLIDEERRALIETLGSLTDEQWQAPSLCAGWRVIDVAAHLAWAPALGPVAGAAAMARHGFSMNRMIAGSAVAWSARGRDAILEQLERNLATGARPIGMPEVAALADAVVHAIDVRRPLGLATPGADRSRRTGRRLRPRDAVAPRRRDRRQHASPAWPAYDWWCLEAGWAHGTGPEVPCRRTRPCV